MIKKIDNFFEEYKKLFKKIWWFLFTGLFFTYVIFGVKIHEKKEITTIDILVLLILIVLIFLPLINEINIYGVGIKKDIEKLGGKVEKGNNEVRKEIVNGMFSIQTFLSNNLNNNNVSNININTREKITKEEIEEVENKAVRERNEIIVRKGEEELEKVDEIRVYLFKVRYVLERKVNTLAEFYSIPRSPLSRNTMNVLNKEGILTRETEIMLAQIIKTCIQAIHGKEIIEEEITQVKIFFPIVIDELNEIIKETT